MREQREQEIREIGRKLGTAPPDRPPDLATRLYLKHTFGDSGPDTEPGHVTHTDVTPGGSADGDPQAAALPPPRPDHPRR